MGDKLRASEWLIGGASTLLLISTFLPWFGLAGAAEVVEAHPGSRAVGEGRSAAIELNVWDLPIARWWVYLSIFLGICVVLAAVLSRTPDWATILLTPLVVTSLFAVVALLFRLIDAPRPYAGAEFGFYLALASSCALFGGVGWALRDESIPTGFDKAPRPELIEVE